MVSGPTMARTDEMYARYVSYPDILDVLRLYAEDATQPGPELFRRIAINIAISNNDDHARNHAAFWDGQHWNWPRPSTSLPGAGPETPSSRRCPSGEVTTD